jgi:hypothetical protein
MKKKGPDETTDRLFPHQMVAESGEVERPIPLQPSIRAEFAQHRLEIETALKAWDARLGEALARLSPVPTVGGTLRRGAIIAGKGTPIAAAVLALLEVTIPILWPQYEGPLKALRQFFGSTQ